MDIRIILILSSLLKGLLCNKILYTNPNTFRLVTFDSRVDNVTTQSLKGNFNDIVAFDFYKNESVIYWSDGANDVVKRYQKINNVEKVDEVLSYLEAVPSYLAVDWVGSKLYWISYDRNTIEVSELDGSHRKVLIWEEINEAQRIIVHPKKRLMFWVYCGRQPRVERSGMDGSERTIIVEMETCIIWPSEMSLDYSEDRLYFSDHEEGKLFSYTIDGLDYKEIIPSRSTHPSQISISPDFIFWLDRITSSIQYCSKKNCSEHRSLTNPDYLPRAFTVVHSERSLPEINPCGETNGGCSHLCLLSPSVRGYSCACPVGIKMSPDGANCTRGPSNILLIVRQRDLRWMSLDTTDYTHFVVPLPAVKHAVYVDYDPIEGRLYWSDISLRSINGAYLNGSGIEVVVNASTILPEGVAVDWLGRNLFWIDSGRNRIQVTHLDGLFHKVLVNTGLQNPRAIVLDPTKGQIFWSDWGNRSKLEMSHMDGSDRRVLVNNNIVWPNGLALDNDRLYWGDASLDIIAYIHLVTMERVVLLENISHAFGLAILGDYIYWSDSTERTINRADKDTGGNRTTIVENLPDLMGLKAAGFYSNKKEGKCSKNNGGCSHFCFVKQDRRVCSCPDDLELLYDDTNCHLPHLFLVYTTSFTIHRVSVMTGLDTRMVTCAGEKGIQAVATNPTDGRIFWSYPADKGIFTVSLYPSQIRKVVSNVEAEDIAVDYESDNFYWSDALTRRIEMMKIGDVIRSIVVWKDLTPTKLAIDPENGWLFWVNVKARSYLIERSRLDGSSRVVLGNCTDPISKIAADVPSKSIFWLEGDALYSTSYDAGTPFVHDLKPFRSFGVLENSIFLSSVERGEIIRVEKNDTKIESKLYRVEFDVVDMNVVNISQNTSKRSSSCRENNGGCSHFCIGVGQSDETSSSSPCRCNDSEDVSGTEAKRCSCRYSHKCACPTHFTLDRDRLTCTAPESYILISQNATILRLQVNETVENTIEVNLHISGIRSIKSLKHDHMERRIFWVDNKNKSLKSIHESGTQQATVLIEPVAIVDMALDGNSQIIYYTEQSCGCIRAVRYNGTRLGTVVLEGQPKHLAVAPRAGYLFWTNRGKTPRLEKSQLDGSSKVTLFNTGLGHLGPIEADDYKRKHVGRTSPTNHREGKIYWIDLELRRIECADFDGNNRAVVVHDTDASGIVLLDAWLMWVTKDSVERISLQEGNVRVKIWSGLPSTMAIASARKDPRGDSNRPTHEGDDGFCPVDTCTHFCIMELEEVNPSDESSIWRCSCPIGMQLVENACEELVACKEDEFTCRSNGYCVPSSWKCDNYPDCVDRSDEIDCSNCSEGRCKNVTPLPCDVGMVGCLDAPKCIAPEQWCDGIPDCDDSSDEKSCKVSGETIRSASSNTYYAVGLGVASAGIILIVSILLLAYICRQKSRNLATAYADNIVMVARPSPPPISLPDSNTMLLGSTELSVQNDGECAIRLAGKRTVPGSSKSFFGNLDDDVAFFDTSIVYRGVADSGTSESVFYDRGHITGASSTTGSALTGRPPFDPPPSPITDRSLTCGSPSLPSYGKSRISNRHHFGKGGGDAYASSNHNSHQGGSSHRPKKRHKRRRMRHLPTTCSSTTDEGTLYDHYLFAPPPPTPQSGFSLSRDLKTLDVSYPPSPYASRSLYPPPPPSSLRCLSEEEDDEEEDGSCEGACSNQAEK